MTDHCKDEEGSHLKGLKKVKGSKVKRKDRRNLYHRSDVVFLQTFGEKILTLGHFECPRVSRIVFVASLLIRSVI